jgi:hypothetical protein
MEEKKIYSIFNTFEQSKYFFNVVNFLLLIFKQNFWMVIRNIWNDLKFYFVSIVRFEIEIFKLKRK